jgi:hypothetical protein
MDSVLLNGIKPHNIEPVRLHVTPTILSLCFQEMIQSPHLGTPSVVGNFLSLHAVAEEFEVPQPVALCVLLVLSTLAVVLRSDFAAERGLCTSG